MSLKTVRIGRRFEVPFRGLNEKIADMAQGLGEATGGRNFVSSDGVLEHRPGTTWSADVDRGATYYATLDGSGGVKFPYTAAYDLLVRWTLVISFRTPATLSGDICLFGKKVEISSSDYYYPGVFIGADGVVTVKLTSAAGVDKSFTSGANSLAADTNYVLQVTRYDTNCYLWWGEEDTKPSIKGNTTELGKTNYPVDEAAVGHPVTLGASWNGSAFADKGAFELHEVTVLSKVVAHQDFGFTRYAAPRDDDVVLHCRFEAASSHFLDLSRNGNDSDAETGATYQQTTNAFVEETALVQLVKEFTNQDGQQRVLIVADGSIVAANYHV